MKVLSFPEHDIILSRLESVEDCILCFYENEEPNINLDALLINVQNSIHHYKLFIGYEENLEED